MNVQRGLRLVARTEELPLWEGLPHRRIPIHLRCVPHEVHRGSDGNTRPLLSDTLGGGGVKLALPGFWLTHPPTLRPTHPDAGCPEGGGGGVTEQFWMKQIQVDHSIAGDYSVHNRV